MLSLVLAAVLAQDGGVEAKALEFIKAIEAAVAIPDASVPVLDATTLAPHFDATVYGQCPEAPPSEVLDGGARLLPYARVVRVDCLMRTCDIDRQLKSEQLKNMAPPWWWVATGVGIIAGVAGGILAGHYLWK